MQKRPLVQLPNNNTIASTKEGQNLLSKHISPTESKVMVLPGLKSASLVSLNQLCDDRGIIGLDNKRLVVVKDQIVVLEGTKNFEHGL